jgi:predicted XRE-type DNA-binding protein
VGSWHILLVGEVVDWFVDLTKNDPGSADLVEDAIDRLAIDGPALGRPLVHRINGSRHHNMKELRPGSTGSSEIRILFAFDPVRRAVLLVAGDKAGNWRPLRRPPGRTENEELRMTVQWDEAKRRAEEPRRAAGHHVRTDAERAAAQRRLDDEIRAFRLAEVRRNRSLTQRQVAESMGVSAPRVSDVERGKLDIVSISVLRAYVEALGGHLKVTAEFDDASYVVA